MEKKEKLIWVVKGALFLIVFAHFTLTVIYVLPLNPVKLKHQTLVEITIGSFFSQRWGLFAPNPIAGNDELLVKCLSNKQDIERWNNITAPLVERVQSNRLTPIGRLERVHGSAIRMYTGNLPYGLSWIKSCKNGEKKACLKYKKMHAPIKKNGKEKLIKIASSYCKGVGYSEGEIAIRIRSDKPFKWSERYQAKEKEFTDIEVGIFPIDKTVTPAKFYR